MTTFDNMRNPKYIIRQEAAACSIADEQNGVTVEWIRGNFNGSQEVSTNPAREHTAQALARILREIGEYLAANYPNLL